VGLPLAKLLAEAGMKIVAADTDDARLHAAKLGIGAIQVVSPDAILQQECDLLSPCAMGGVLDAAAIDQLRCRMVYGSANNQLAAVSQHEEIALAERLAARGILYQPDWTHNTAGVMAGWEEYLHQADAKLARIEPHLIRVCEEGTRDLLAEHQRTGKTPTALAYAQVERWIYPEPGARS
jgi:leucine dehydrogenase